MPNDLVLDLLGQPRDGEHRFLIPRSSPACPTGRKRATVKHSPRHLLVTRRPALMAPLIPDK